MSASPRLGSRGAARVQTRRARRPWTTAGASDDRLSLRRAGAEPTPRQPHRAPARSMRERSGYRRAHWPTADGRLPPHRSRCHTTRRRERAATASGRGGRAYALLRCWLTPPPPRIRREACSEVDRGVLLSLSRHLAPARSDWRRRSRPHCGRSAGLARDCSRANVCDGSIAAALLLPPIRKGWTAVVGAPARGAQQRPRWPRRRPPRLSLSDTSGRKRCVARAPGGTHFAPGDSYSRRGPRCREPFPGCRSVAGVREPPKRAEGSTHPLCSIAAFPRRRRLRLRSPNGAAEVAMRGVPRRVRHGEIPPWWRSP
jgi:hypothetical protein